MSDRPAPPRFAALSAAHVAPVQRRLLLPLTLTLFVLIGGFVAVLVGMHDSRLKCIGRQGLQAATDKMHLLLDEQTKALTALGAMLSHDPQLPALLAAADRAGLLARYAEDFARLRRDYGITHFYFHTPERINLLRLHQPERHGDRIERFTARAAERTGQVATGVELGAFGLLVLRMVRPLHDEHGKLLGYLELGKEIEDVLAGIHAGGHIQLALAIDKRLLQRADWEQGMTLLKRQFEWERFPGHALVYCSLPRAPELTAAGLPLR